MKEDQESWPKIGFVERSWRDYLRDEEEASKPEDVIGKDAG